MAYDQVLRALSDPTRREILERLADGARPVGELAGSLPISRPAVSQHLRVLEQARLVSVERRGARRLYRAEPSGLLELQLYLTRFWGEALRRYARRTAAEARRSRR